MVKFENIRVDGMYIYAHEVDMMEDVSCNIRLHVENEDYYAYGMLTVAMIRALWNLQSRYIESWFTGCRGYCLGLEGYGCLTSFILREVSRFLEIYCT